jgi:hypothetical protein
MRRVNLEWEYSGNVGFPLTSECGTLQPSAVANDPGSRTLLSYE